MGVIALLLWNQLTVPVRVVSVSEQAQASPEPTAQAEISLPPPPVVRSGDLVVIRGAVVASHGEVLIIDCDRDPVKPGFAWNVDAGSGAGGIAQLAELAAGDTKKQIEETFGPLKTVSNGTLRSAPLNSAPTERPMGRFAIYGYPAKAGRIHVVAAPTGAQYEGVPLYSATFKVGVPTSASTPRSIFPPGVDTPEQRREYLKALAEARKNQSQSPSEQHRSVRGRGY